MVNVKKCVSKSMDIQIPKFVSTINILWRHTNAFIEFTPNVG